MPASSHTALRLLRECGVSRRAKPRGSSSDGPGGRARGKNYAFWTAVATELEKLAKEPGLMSAKRPMKDDEPSREAGQF